MITQLRPGVTEQQQRRAGACRPHEFDDLTRVTRSSRDMLGQQRSGGPGHQARVSHGHPIMSNSDTRCSVIFGVCRQDPERWREFDSIYRPMLFAFLRKQGLPETDAGDVVQDIFVKLLGKIHTYSRERCKFRTWLFAIAHNTLVDYARRRASQKRAVDGWIKTMLRSSASDSLEMAAAWAKLHRSKILAHALETVRSRNSGRVWACFEQRLLRDRAGALIAAELGLEPGAVYVNCSRVLKQVREVCQEFDEDISNAIESHVSGRD